MDIDYYNIVPSELQSGFDYLFIGPEPVPVDRPGFGAFVTAGNLDGLIGDDVIVIDPPARAPDNAAYSGILHVFYHGSYPSPLIISPNSSDLDGCGGELTFNIQGGIPPYQFRWTSYYKTPSGLILFAEGLPPGFNAQNAGAHLSLALNGCAESDLVSLRVIATDNTGSEATAYINILPSSRLSVSPSAIDFGDTEISNTLTLAAIGSEDASWSILEDLPSWLNVSSMNGSIAAAESIERTVNVNRSGLVAGATYTHTIQIESNGLVYPVEITMSLPQVSIEHRPILSVDRESIDFGLTGKNNSFGLSNTGDMALIWSITNDLPEWLNVAPMSGSRLPGQGTFVSVTVNRSGLATGTYSHTLLITSNGGNKTITISMEVPSLTISPESAQMDQCGDEMLFTVTGGVPPYTFD
jgi:hypothetical protein